VKRVGFSKSSGQMVAIYSAIVGLAYVLLGLLEIAGGLSVELPMLAGLAEAFYVVGDIYAGFVLLVIGAVYLGGLGAVSRGDREGLSFVSVGAIMSTVLLILYLANILSNGLGLVLSFEDWLEWTLMDDIRPGLLLWFLAIPAVIIARKKDWRE
jgi:hypothetical protein